MKMRSHWLYALVPLFFLAVFSPAAAEQEKDDPLRNAALSGDTAAQLKLASEFFFGTDAVRATRAGGLLVSQGGRNWAVPKAPTISEYVMKRGGGSSTRVWCGRARCFDEAAKGGLPEARLRKALLMISGIPDEAEEKETLPGTPARPRRRVAASARPGRNRLSSGGPGARADDFAGCRVAAELRDGGAAVADPGGGFGRRRFAADAGCLL